MFKILSLNVKDQELNSLISWHYDVENVTSVSKFLDRLKYFSYNIIILGYFKEKNELDKILNIIEQKNPVSKIVFLSYNLNFSIPEKIKEEHKGLIFIKNPMDIIFSIESLSMNGAGPKVPREENILTKEARREIRNKRKRDLFQKMFSKMLKDIKIE